MIEPGFYNMDCMLGMAQFPDKFFELAIVDPPYCHNSGNAFTSRLKKYGQLQYNNEKPTAEYFNELKRVSVNQIIWGGNYFIDWLSNTKCMIAWWKHQPVVTYAQIELAWTSFQDRHANIYNYAYFGNINAEKDRCHPNQKPIALYKWLLSNYAKPGDKILDTHVGSASSLIACHQMGFEYWGFELDPDYFNAATERLNKAKAQVSMAELVENPTVEQNEITEGDIV